MIDTEYYKLEIELTIIGAIILGIITFIFGGCTQIQFINISEEYVDYNIEYINTQDTINITDKNIIIYGDLNQPIYDNLLNEKVEIYNTRGVCIYTTNEKIDITLPKGIYLVKIGKLTQKIIVN